MSMSVKQHNTGYVKQHNQLLDGIFPFALGTTAMQRRQTLLQP